MSRTYLDKRDSDDGYAAAFALAVVLAPFFLLYEVGRWLLSKLLPPKPPTNPVHYKEHYDV